MPPPAPQPLQPTRKELADIRKHNLAVRSEAYRAVRRPGRGQHNFNYLPQNKTKYCFIIILIVVSLFNRMLAFVSDFAKLFEQLKQLKGSVDIKKELIREVINESLRFKRKALAKLLEDFLAGLEKNGNSASVNLKRLTNSVYNNSTNNYS